MRRRLATIPAVALTATALTGCGGDEADAPLKARGTGASKAAGPVAAKHADVYLTWGEPPAWIRGLAAEEGSARIPFAAAASR